MNYRFQKRRTKAFTLVEILVAAPLVLLCLAVLLTVIWIGSRLIARNISINLAHLEVALPMQVFAEDVHASMAMPVLTGTLVSGSGVLPPGLSGSNSVLAGKMTKWKIATTSSGTAAGVSFYVTASSLAMESSTNTSTANYAVNYGGYPVASGAYSASSKQIAVELGTADDQALFSNAVGMHLCIPGSAIVTTSTNMLDVVISSVSFTGSPGASADKSTLVANCTLSGSLGTSLNTLGSRTLSSSYVYQAYLVAPINYVVCGTDLIRLSYDGSWKVVMRNLLPGDSSNTISPFSLPYPSSESFLSTGTSGRRAVTVRFATTNPDYNRDVKIRGAASNMMLYDVTLWSRVQFYDELSR